MIGILDSGVGGLSVLKEVHQRLPQHTITYVGDSDWCPYGNKPYEEIIERCRLICDFLLSRGASVIVIACNSATIAAVETLRSEYPIPFVGMEPGVKPAAQLSQTGVIGVLATEASLKGEKFHQLLSIHAQGLRVITQPCPEFVEFVEAGILEGPAVDAAIKSYTAHMLTEKADVIILGCTHYPFLKNPITQHIPDSVQIIDTGSAVAKQTAALIEPLSQNLEAGRIKIYTTGSLEHLQTLIPTLCPELSAKYDTLSL